MPTAPSPGFTVAFATLCLVMAAGFVAAVYRAGVALGEPPMANRRTTRRAALGTVAWLALTGGAAAAGLLAFGPMPPPLLVMMALAVVGLVALARSPFGARLAGGLPLGLLIGFQAFRVPVELLLHRAWIEGLIGAQMTYLGYNFDVLTGLTALPMAWWAVRGGAPRGAIAAWNLMGLGLLITVVTIAVLSAPVPFRVFVDGPANVWVTHPPFVWLPAVLVALALLGHLLLWRRLGLDRAPATGA